MPIVLHPFRRKNPRAHIPETTFPDPYFFTDTEHRIINNDLALLNTNGLIFAPIAELACRMLKKSVQQGRSERRGEAYAVVR